MTYRDNEREAIVDELLLDADLSDPSDVRLALLSIGSLANLAAPAPGAELAAMMAGPHDELTKRRWRHKHRTAVVSVAVVAAMGLGVSGVAAASSGFTRAPSLAGLMGNFVPQWSAATPVLPAPDAPRITTEPAPVVDPAAVPPATQAPAIPAPADAAPVPAQNPVIVPEPVPAAAVPNAAQQAVPVPPVAAPNASSNGAAPKPVDAKPAEAKPERPAAVKPKPAPSAPAAAAKPGTSDKRPGHASPSLTDKKADKELQSFLYRLKQWTKRGDR